MKTILIPIFHGHLARNILRTEVLNDLMKQAGVRVVILAPNYKKDYYAAEFGRDNVIIQGIGSLKFSALDRFFRSLYYYFVGSKTVQIIQGEQFLPSCCYIKYAVTRLLTFIFSRLKMLRQLVRFLDRKLVVTDPNVESVFDTYRPDLVFIPSITSEQDTMVLRAAKRRGVRSIAMVRSWDNITVNKGNVRILPDKFIVHSEILKQDLVRYCDTDARKIEVVGLSHFDYYATGQRIPRDEFLQSIGGNPAKKFIYFMPIGLSDQKEDDKIMEILSQILARHKELENYELLVTLHPNTAKDLEFVLPDVVKIKPCGLISFTNGRLVDREITKQAMEFMASTIFYSDLIINYQGTTSLDAAAFDKPVINIAFDAVPKPYLKSVRRFYDFTHYQPILKSGGVRLAHSAKELEKLILDYIKNPQLDREGRKRMTLEQGFDPEGKASEKTARAILSALP